ncbi:MAG: hypothetical protein KDJ86_10185 [Bauldia sp.]|uniref:hypothetical protein n=1 Tax=Bauldia sp. TaxID=2575872 RepID=UPI001DB6CD63|nr:hypothetical protein [Bauldia sp.]MCB1496143.1 hypothetical protein [Bauldia sp.]
MFTMLVFAALGPAIGGLVVIATLVFLGFNVTTHDASVWFLSATIWGLWLAYPIGAFPALLVGGIFAVVDYDRQRSTLLAAAFVGLMAGVVWVLSMGHSPGDSLMSNAIVAGSGIATVCCWWLRRRRAS